MNWLARKLPSVLAAFAVVVASVHCACLSGMPATPTEFSAHAACPCCETRQHDGPAANERGKQPRTPSKACGHCHGAVTTEMVRTQDVSLLSTNLPFLPLPFHAGREFDPAT